MRAISLFAFILMVNSALAAAKDPYKQLDELAAALPADNTQGAANYQAIDLLARSHAGDPAFQAKVAERIANNDPLRAIAYANNAISLAPMRSDYRLLRANISYTLGNFGDAVSDAQDVLKKEPDNQAAISILKLSREKSARAAISGVIPPGSPPRAIEATATSAGFTYTERRAPRRNPFAIDQPIQLRSEGLPAPKRSFSDRLTSLWNRAKERALERVDSQFGLTPEERPVAAKGAVVGMVLAGGGGTIIYGGFGLVACAPMRVFAGAVAHAGCTVAVGTAGGLFTSPAGAYAGAKTAVWTKRKYDEYRNGLNAIAAGIIPRGANEH